MRQLWQWFKSFLGQIFNPGDKILTGSTPQGSSSQSNPHQTLSEAVPVPLSDADYEFLFSQLMEGVNQGWQVERVALFFEKLGDRTNSDQWLEWLRAYRARLLGTRSPQTQHANQMMKVGEMMRSLPKWRSVGEATYEIGLQLRLRSQGSSLWEYMSPSLTANAAPTPSESSPSPPPASETLSTPISSEPPQEKVDEMDTVDVQSSDSKSSPLFYPEMVTDLWDESPETPEALSNGQLVSETTVEVPAVEKEIEPAQSELVSDSQPESATSPEEYIRQQPVINLAYSADGKQWTETVSLNELLEKLTKMPNLTAQFSQQVGINSQNPEEIVEAIYQQLYKIYQEHQGNNTVDEAILLLNEGMQQAKAGRYADAIATWDRALSQQPGLYKAWLNRGNALLILGQPQAAIESYDKALELQPELYEAWGNKGVALLNLGKCEEAIASFDRAIEFKSDYHQAWDNRGLALRQLGQIKEAIASFDRAIAINPDDTSALKHRVDTLKLRGSQE
ncbi:tetratricopeptide repeat protein [Roseofilum sp. BLCC_M154]|uniref:Tetratricopeptide repeat protein n=1 Tax=Roseofilum acuticapitatum BLCC-M154 TaxID=3022444 RepID=A0ABT7AP69_9CYAN|nr:tetratricopeptide repeat protein [Roseofilum acuticapitatum]MDJ1168244.1 tetratricopeptide repeat protein [Roseofilum acuticapitatum BLCC-M154]